MEDTKEQSMTEVYAELHKEEQEWLKPWALKHNPPAVAAWIMNGTSPNILKMRGYGPYAYGMGRRDGETYMEIAKKHIRLYVKYRYDPDAVTDTEAK
jgi:hypothetical protein